MDFGGLVGARRVGIATGGCAPKGYKTEVGNKPDELKAFGLVEHLSPDYTHRTKENVKSVDATLIIATQPESDGTRATLAYCKALNKPYLMVDPTDNCVEQIRQFLEVEKPAVLNIAGNRESKSKGLTARTVKIIEMLFTER